MLTKTDIEDGAGGTVGGEFEVADPEILRPKALPFVVQPSNGGTWKNEEQAAFAQTLNGYAYKNPQKWAEKKDVLLKQLSDIGTNPSLHSKLRGGDQEVAYNDKAYGQNILSR